MIDFIKNIDMGLAYFITYLTAAGLFWRFVMVPKMENLVYKRTESIQPDSNGSKSLPDIALAVGEMKSDLKHLARRLDKIERNTREKPL